MIADMTLNAFLEELASNSPAPGGGSAAAVSGALGAALISMVCRLTLGKKGYESVEEEIKTALDKSDELCKTLTSLIDEDITAFNTLMDTLKMPKETPDQKNIRNTMLQNAFRKAAESPLKIASACLETIILAKEIVNKANKNLISDIGVAAQQAYGGLESAIINVKVNLPYIKDKTYQDNMSKQIEILSAQGQNYRDYTCGEMNKQIG
ncbi:MAG: cyclodeaminase/cyclohydrolase family protein [Syntrophomonadaceae bacterium]|nr:cyclodeaminase/cyclohydrolase family protein [Syntrophomonadaceae bacterium]